MPRKEKIVVELSPEVVAPLKRIADAIAPEHHAPPIGDTKRLVESDQRDHPVKWVPPRIEKGPTGYGQIELDAKYVESLNLTVAETDDPEVAFTPGRKADRVQALLERSDQELRDKGFDVPPRKKWWDNIEPGVD